MHRIRAMDVLRSGLAAVRIGVTAKPYGLDRWATMSPRDNYAMLDVASARTVTLEYIVETSLRAHVWRPIGARERTAVVLPVRLAYTNWRIRKWCGKRRGDA